MSWRTLSGDGNAAARLHIAVPMLRQWRRTVILVIVLLSAACRQRVNVDAVRAEFAQIVAPRTARVMDHVVRPKNQSVRAEYVGNLTRAEIAAHYAEVMTQAGWTPCGEATIRDWGRDVGNRQYAFSKGDLSATVFVPGDRRVYRYSYSLHIGPAERYPWEKPGCRQ